MSPRRAFTAAARPGHVRVTGQPAMVSAGSSVEAGTQDVLVLLKFRRRRGRPRNRRGSFPAAERQVAHLESVGGDVEQTARKFGVSVGTVKRNQRRLKRRR
jgi:hypothetical protein